MANSFLTFEDLVLIEAYAILAQQVGDAEAAALLPAHLQWVPDWARTVRPCS